MAKLVIVESPSKAKTISKYLGGGYTVKASVGHIRDLPKSNKNAVDIKGGFAPRYEIVKGKEKIVEELRQAAQQADEVILATDLDREGEAIAWHLSELLKLPKGKRGRITYSEITKEAVEEALKHPRDIDDNLRHAQEARRVLDRLVGYDLSGLIWKKVRYGLSAGRVQSPALRILMEREREIRAFKPQKYWTITALLQNGKGEKLQLLCSKEPTDKAEADFILEKGRNGDWQVLAVEESETKRSPRAPFITSTLQQAASSRLFLSPARTMAIAQKLYEAGLITYMRTDSVNLSDSAKKQIAAVVAEKFGENFRESRAYSTKVKNAQEAHEAIRPTDFSKQTAGVGDQKKLYDLIWRRAVASQMADAKIAKTKISVGVNAQSPQPSAKTAARPGGETPDFFTIGSRLLFPGWLAADPAARGNDVELPKVAAGEKLRLIGIKAEEKETMPPPRYSEAGLIKELEKRGIGRPSTYASIMKTLEDRGYVVKENRALKPTDTGEVVSDFLEKNFANYINDTFTAQMEDKLDEIAAGKREYAKTLADFYKPFSKEVKSREKIEKLTFLGNAEPHFKCPLCGGGMVVKLGRTGKFLSCKRFPDCEGALTADGKILPKNNEPIGIHPQTSQPIFVKNGRFGPYLQLGENRKSGDSKPKMASIPRDINPVDVTLETALKLLSLPRTLGKHPETGKEVIASRGRFGPYLAHNGDFRSIKKGDDVYTIGLDRALEIFSEPKKNRNTKRNS